jgi:hypothetical protein
VFAAAEVSVDVRNDSTSDLSFCRLSRRAAFLDCWRLSSGSCAASSFCSASSSSRPLTDCGSGWSRS